MNKITLKEIRDLDPCYDPSLHMKEDWEGTLVDFLQIDVIPNHNRIWVAVRLAPRTLVEIFAIDCAFAAYGYDTSDTAASCSYSASAYTADAASASAYAASCSASASDAASAAYAAADYADAASDADSADSDAYAAYAASNAYYASSAYHASSTAAAAASSARNQQRENQIDALIMLLEGE